MLAVSNRPQKVNRWSCSPNCDTHVDWAVTVNPIYVCRLWKRNGDNTHHCRSPTPALNGCDLTSPTLTQTSEQQYSDLKLTVSNWWPSTPYSRNTPKYFHEEPRRMFSRGRQSMPKRFGILPRFLEIWSVVLPGRKPHWVWPSFGSIISRYLFSRHMAYTFLGRLRREMPR